jgi:hypothetical protein
LLYSPEDGGSWTDYIGEGLGRINIAVERVTLEASGSLTRKQPVHRSCSPRRTIVSPTQTPAVPPQDVVVIIVTPGLLLTFIANPSARVNDLLPVAVSPEVASKTPSSDGTDCGERIVLFLCGTNLEDFERLDKSNRKLSERFVGMDRWPKVSSDNYDELSKTVIKMLDRTRRRKEPRNKAMETKQETTTHGKVVRKMSRQKMTFKLFPTEVKSEVSSEHVYYVALLRSC